MNTDQIESEARDVTSKVKETTGDSSLEGQGLADQLRRKLQNVFGGHVGDEEPFADRVRRFAKARPFASAALAAVVGVAVLNSLRGKGSARR